MSTKIRETVQRLLAEGKIKGFLGLREENGHIFPHLFCDPEELKHLSSGDKRKPGDARYPLNQILIRLAIEYPEETFAVLIRGCDERGLSELFKWKQLLKERVIPIGLGCPDELAKACECEKPFPDCLVDGPKGEKVDSQKVARVNRMDLEDRLNSGRLSLIVVSSALGVEMSAPCVFARNAPLRRRTWSIQEKSHRPIPRSI